VRGGGKGTESRKLTYGKVGQVGLGEKNIEKVVHSRPMNLTTHSGLRFRPKLGIGKNQRI
jgi:hypothetical protein